MAQNIYDDPAFFAGYSAFPRSREGLAATAEWPAFCALLPAIAGRRVVDLGCGFGHLSRWLADAGAVSVVGYDLSENMLAQARGRAAGPTLRYQRADLETLELPPASADLVVSAMTLHYIEDFARLAAMLHRALSPGGTLVFSVEHPIFAARATPEWVETADGERAFAIANYGREGRRVTHWIADGVVKYHRSIATMLNTLCRAGFAFVALNEWRPSDADLERRPDWLDEMHRPMFLIVSMQRP